MDCKQNKTTDKGIRYVYNVILKKTQSRYSLPGLATFGIYKKSLTFDVTFEGSLLWELYGSYKCDPSVNLWNMSTEHVLQSEKM